MIWKPDNSEYSFFQGWPAIIRRVKLYTIGHSNREIDALIAILRASGIDLLVDVRRSPGSRRFVQFNRDQLSQSLEQAAIGYVWEGRDLGGRRNETAGADDHPALPDESLRRYAAHMTTDAFRTGIRRVIEHAATHVVVIMCAERDPTRCHRSMIADYLVASGHAVDHLVDPGVSHPHGLSPQARLIEGVLRYDRYAQPSLDF